MKHLQRQHELQEALSSTAGTGYFTVGERIIINQERGYLLSIGTEEELRHFKVTEAIEDKLYLLRK